MKVTVTAYLNVRVGKPSVNAPCYQYIAPGSVLEVDEQLYKGDLFDGIDTWLKDEADNYYWIGGVNHPVTEQEFHKLTNNKIDGKVTFDWFNNLRIEDIWNKFKEKGDKAKVVILDTGYNLSNTDISNGVSGSRIIIDESKYPGKTFIINDQSNDRHGTRCASLIGARNSKDWIIGIAPECELLIGKISIDKEILDFNYIMEGIRWGISQKADIISISYAYEDLTENEVAVINSELTQLLAGKNVLIFAAAGNAGNTPKKADFYPASFDDCISVGSVDTTNNISSFTVLSDKTILHAIGENIESYNENNMPTPESGTSFSTPIAAAVAALAVSFLKKKNATHSFDKDDLVKKLKNTGDPVKGSNTKKTINPLNLFNNL
ncbi:MAG TPA: S8/S53 family peptidase [Panacibacter sp.]|nr:S8/S53 family peptidase [Panacibacter sp.]